MTRESEMKKIFLFDWGNTLMVDFPEQHGKMCHWEYVESVSGAKKVLEVLSQSHPIYVATSARDSSELEIHEAFKRAELSDYIDGYFCVANIGLEKNCPEFYQAILSTLSVDGSQVVMVGDVLEKDIFPAIEAGLSAVWLSDASETESQNLPAEVMKISSIRELLDLNL
ncbi:HAD family hydrolase [Vibrio makurazakiensis]|uniref:HAD family hydrolase n=1 Tax=Vibrio makurazakiensis TaxID=2910250 RepID=UPI003D0A99A9